MLCVQVDLTHEKITKMLNTGSSGIVEVATILTLLVSFYIAYRSKANSLNTYREEEQFLGSRLSGTTAIEEPFAVTIEKVEIQERDDFQYRVKRLLLRPVEGSTRVWVRWETHSLGGDIWETEFKDILSDKFEFEIEHVESDVIGDKGMSVFDVDTLDPDDVSIFATSLPGVAKILIENMDGFQAEPIESQFKLS